MIDGVPNSNEIMHTFEPQLPVTLDLSCIEASPLPRDENPNRPRNPDLARDVEMALELPGQWAPLPIEELSTWVESQILIAPDAPSD
jgi:hypothetical protein